MRQSWPPMASPPDDRKGSGPLSGLQRFRYLLCLLLVPLLVSCAWIDSDQARLCRGILPALHPADTAITIRSIAPGLAENSIRIVYGRETSNGVTNHAVACFFGGGRLSSERQVLTAVMQDGTRLSDIRLHLLRRYWLDEPSTALLAPPISDDELRHLPTLTRGAALTLQHVLSALPKIAIYALLAPAYALIYGLIGRINLAFGELAIIGGQAALIGAVGGAMVANSPMAALLTALVFALAAAATHGEFMARAVFHPLRKRPGQAVLVASAGLAIALSEYVRLAQGSGSRWTPPMLNAPVMVAKAGDFIVTVTEGSLATVLASVVATAIVVVVMKRSGFGRRWRASADDALAASLLGVDARAVLVQAFALASLLAGLAGFILTAHYGGIGFSGGLVIGLKALIGAIAGGIGSVPGAMAGAVLIGTCEAVFAAFFSVEHADAAVYLALVLLLVFRPGGLFGFGDGSPRRV
jgi:branched-chain amino acid transport system permease protein